jgi:hypothetical protein
MSEDSLEEAAAEEPEIVVRYTEIEEAYNCDRSFYLAW